MGTGLRFLRVSGEALRRHVSEPGEPRRSGRHPDRMNRSAPPSSSRTDDARPGGCAEHPVSGVKRAPDDDRSLGDHAPMTAAAHPRAQHDSPSGPHTADVLVIFGITGDLAKVMTFLSLYRLERRGLLDCPIVGVAGDDWTVDDPKKRAPPSIRTAGG